MWAFRNGKFIPLEEARVSVLDAGFVLGATVAEQIRTFRGELFRLPEHLTRLRRSLEIVGTPLPLTFEALAEAALELVARNAAELAAGDGQGLAIYVTPGVYGTFTGLGETGPMLGMLSFPLPFSQWVDTYREGQALWITETRQVPGNCWPAELKCRSRMHYHLADQEARRRDPRSRALLLDQEGFLSEASTANLLVWRGDEGLLASPVEKILPGISMDTLFRLAADLGLPHGHRELAPADLFTAEEAFLCSTSPCLLPVARVDGKPIGSGTPGPVFARLLAAWSERVGVDIAAQAERFRGR